ncbi:YqfO family protein [Agarilytica rhodophyticola]|uniref:Nif3-like dinuclear metal center hexameric protein n=1 Tax=Agarilytica rhodophyticola TaxID=1737490 RepID=UPI000B34712F|nr:YqfO family protein [Agarilytica rhodophyticola]
MFKIGFYVPPSHLEIVKNAMFRAGAGRIGDYDQCCWQCLGQGQFRPNSQSQPFIGQPNELELLPEYRVEMVCPDNNIHAVMDAMKHAHPYEEPAYDVCTLVDF